MMKSKMKLLKKTTRGPCIQDLVTSSLKRFEASSIEIARPQVIVIGNGEQKLWPTRKPKKVPHSARSTLVLRSS
jgi:hypothetical protein